MSSDHETNKKKKKINDRKTKIMNKTECEKDRNWRKSIKQCGKHISIYTFIECWSWKCWMLLKLSFLLSFRFKILHTWLLIRGQNVKFRNQCVDFASLLYLISLIFVMCVIFFHFFSLHFSSQIQSLSVQYQKIT